MDTEQLKQFINSIIDERLGELVGNTQDLFEKRLYEILEGQAAYHMADKLAEQFEQMFDRAYVAMIKGEYNRIMESEVETPQPNYDGEGGDYTVPEPEPEPAPIPRKKLAVAPQQVNEVEVNND